MRQKIILYVSKIVDKDYISYEKVSNLAWEVGHLKTARTNTQVRDTADLYIYIKGIDFLKRSSSNWGFYISRFEYKRSKMQLTRK